MKKSFLLIFVIISILYSCKSEPEKTDDSTDAVHSIIYSAGLSQIVSGISSGTMRSTDKISIYFTDYITDSDSLNKEIDKDIISITPSLDGKLYWEYGDRLVFEPEEPMKFREEYSVSIDVKELSENFEDLDIELLKFKFDIAGRELSEFKGDLILKNKNEPGIVNYKGKISFSEKTDVEDVKSAVSLSEGFKSYSIEIFPEKDERSFNFISEDLLRDDNTKDFSFEIDKSDLDISEDFEKEFQVTTLKEMKVVNVSLDEENKNPKIKIEFSDEIDFEQNINGLVNVKGVQDLKIQKIGSSLVLDGNFQFGGAYEISIEKGLRSRWGTKITETINKKVKFSNLVPRIEFASDGVIMPKGNNYKLQFYTSNIKRVHVELKKVYQKNISEFLRSEKLSSGSGRKEAFANTYINRIGVIVHNETFEITADKNKTLLSEIDLSKVFDKYENGMYLVRLNFNPADMLVNVDDEKFKYIEENGQIYKPIVYSNIGLTVKKNDRKYTVYATNLTTGKAMPEVNLTLRTNYYDNRYSIKGKTNNQGIAEITPNRNYYYHCIEAEYNGEFSYVKFDEMQWNISGFDIGGAEPEGRGTKAFIYTERGVYRPGDEINLSVIARHNQKEYPDNHPVTILVKNPERQTVYELTNKKNVDGFYNFKIQTKDSDPTGNWRVEFKIGNRYFSHVLKIETIVPYRLKVKIIPELQKVLWNHKEFKFDVNCNYLFGNPGSNLPLEVDLEITQIRKRFAKYSNFNFTNETMDFQTIQKNVFKGKLNEEGIKNINWELPTLSGVPSALNIKATATVLEKGGRPNTNWANITYDTYSHYVGLQPLKYRWLAAGTDVNIPVILVNPDGKPIAGKTIKYKIYRNNKHWWWYYNRQNKLRYKTDNNTVLVKQGELISNVDHTNIEFVPIERGSYLIEVIDESGSGHSATTTINAYGYGGFAGSDKNSGTLRLKSDKEKYYVGEEAIIKFPVPKEGSVLLTVEKGNTILKQKWYSPNDENEMEIKIPITSEMTPNAYISVSVIQPHDQTVNDRPIRVFGILPINVEDKQSRHYIDIKTTKTFRPEEPFEIELQTKDYKETQFTIAVVDEGLLDITQFKTPNPWKHFYKKIRLGVNTYDIFSQILTANIGDVFKTFSIGGDMDYRESQEKPDKGKKRFKPVSMFRGPIVTNSNGYAKVKLNMPNYIGSVRIMVIGAKDDSYAKAEKTVPVKSELMLLPTLPRVAGPGEKFTIPVSVFAMEDNIGKVNVMVKTDGPLSVDGQNSVSLSFDEADDKDCYFEIATKQAAGQAKVTIIAKSKDYSASYDVDLMVRPNSPRIYNSYEYRITKGEDLDIKIPGDGIIGTNNATITVSNFPNMNFNHRLEWLIHYPYGCIEQTTSSVFPQLYLKNFITYPEARTNEIDANINSGISRLRMFQTFSGGFSYWPYETEVSNWGNLYAGHFIVEAKGLGYHVPEDLLSNWLKYTKRQARSHKGDLVTRVYRSYILAIAGDPALAEMNAIKEGLFDKLKDTQKWQLAAAYHLAGLQDEAEKIIANAGMKVEDYSEFAGSYGSSLRDNAMILDASVVLQDYKTADDLTRAIGASVSARNWYSTQTIGYSLLALGKYMHSINKTSEKIIIKGEIEFDDEDDVDFENEKTFEYTIKEDFGKIINVSIEDETTIEKPYVTVSWNGVPLQSQVKDESKNIGLTVKWYDDDGDEIDPTVIKQGTTFWGHFTVENKSSLDRIDEMALVHVLPSGWEIVNTRLLNETLPVWTKKLRLRREQYLDIRDDRIMWFFDLQNDRRNNQVIRTYDFVVKLSAVSVGEFNLPGIITEAMYNDLYKASKAGMKVQVTK